MHCWTCKWSAAECNSSRRAWLIEPHGYSCCASFQPDRFLPASRTAKTVPRAGAHPRAQEYGPVSFNRPGGGLRIWCFNNILWLWKVFKRKDKVLRPDIPVGPAFKNPLCYFSSQDQNSLAELAEVPLVFYPEFIHVPGYSHCSTFQQTAAPPASLVAKTVPGVAQGACHRNTTSF